jgi:glyoxylase-like metal-dependent hydrolase (beta-lactamase superfamily II)
LTKKWEVYAFRYAAMPERYEAELFIGGRPGANWGMDYFFWMLRSGEEVIVVDTGANSAKMPAKGRTPLISIEAALAGVGVNAADVDKVFLTHAHWDHVGNLDSFPKAHFWMQQAEMASITGPDMTFAKIRGAYQSDEVQRLVGLVYEDRLTFLDGDGSFADGVDYLFMPGHSAGQTALQIETASGPLLLASDAVHYYREVAEELCFLAFNDAKEMLAGLRKCKALVGGNWDRMIPGHDPQITWRYPAETRLDNGDPVALRVDLPAMKPLEL